MLTELERKEIESMLKKYKAVTGTLWRNYSSRRAHMRQDSIAARAWFYLGKMRSNMDSLTSDDVKYFALLVDKFDQMRREKLFKELQKYADFDVAGFVSLYNRGKVKSLSQSGKMHFKELSGAQMDKMCRKYRDLCDAMSRGDKDCSYASMLAEKYRLRAYDYACAIVNGVVDVKPENLKSARNFLQTVCYPFVSGDVVDVAQGILNKKIAALDEKTEETPVENVAQEKPNVENSNQKKGFFKRQERKNRRIDEFEQVKAVLGKAVSGVVENVAEGFSSVAENVKEKFNAVKEKYEAEKRNRQIIRDAERESKQHWKQLKREEKQAEEEKKNLGRFYRNLFAHPSVAPIAALVAVAGMWIMFLPTNNNIPVKSDKKNIKTEKPVVQKAATVAIDTAYMNALNNYYNSALDIIAGAKKDGVLNKIKNQVNAGNVVLTDSVSVERLAYAYFIYREYGFNIDLLNLAVNGSQKLTDAQNAELNKIIMDAGERGTGVQKQAKQRVESRGGTLGQHSKFKHATKQQQRQHLVSLGVLKHIQRTR